VEQGEVAGEAWGDSESARASTRLCFRFRTGSGMDEMAHRHEEWPRVRAQSRRSWSHGICIGHCGLQLWNPEPETAGSRASRCPEVAWKRRWKQVLLTRVMDESGNKWHSETLAGFARPSKLLLNGRVEGTLLLYHSRVSRRGIYKSDLNRRRTNASDGRTRRENPPRDPTTWFTRRDLPESRNCCDRSLIWAGNPRDMRRRATVRGAA